MCVCMWFVHPSSRKSQSSEILKEKTSGSALMTFGIPLYLGSFASESPIVRDTANRPGSTRNGPVMYSILFWDVYTGIWDLGWGKNGYLTGRSILHSRWSSAPRQGCSVYDRRLFTLLSHPTPERRVLWSRLHWPRSRFGLGLWKIVYTDNEGTYSTWSRFLDCTATVCDFQVGSLGLLESPFDGCFGTLWEMFISYDLKITNQHDLDT